MRVRLGAVGFLNSRPLTVPLEDDRVDFRLDYAVPARCAADLHAGRADVGLIPSIEYARAAVPYCIVPQVAVGCQGEVLTVRMFYRGAPQAIQRLALDPSSRTSAALVRILLKECYGLEPQIVAAGAGLEDSLACADAALLIGDPVFAALDSGHASLDLGSLWWQLTGLPFVFAFWAGRQGALSPAQAQRLIEARRHGQQGVAAIARAYAATHGGDAGFYQRYLSEYVRFDLGPKQIEGLQRFYALAQRHGLIEDVPELRFFELE